MATKPKSVKKIKRYARRKMRRDKDTNYTAVKKKANFERIIN